MNVGLSIVAGIISIIAIILRARLNREKTRAEKIAEAAAVVEKRSTALAKKIAEGRTYDVVAEMDALVRSNRMLRLLASNDHQSSD